MASFDIGKLFFRKDIKFHCETVEQVIGPAPGEERLQAQKAQLLIWGFQRTCPDTGEVTSRTHMMGKGVGTTTPSADPKLATAVQQLAEKEQQAIELAQQLYESRGEALDLAEKYDLLQIELNKAKSSNQQVEATTDTCQFEEGFDQDDEFSSTKLPAQLCA